MEGRRVYRESSKTTMSIGNLWQHLNKKKAAQLLLIVLVFIFVIGLLMLGFRKVVRAQQLEDVMSSTFKQDKVVLIENGNIKKVIDEERTLAILYVTPGTKDFKTIEMVLNQKENIQMLNEKLFVYPMFYRLDKELKNYKIEEDAALVYYENGKETNRIDLADLEDIEADIIKEINHLSMYSIKSF